MAEPPAERADFRKNQKAAVAPSAGIHFGKKAKSVSWHLLCLRRALNAGQRATLFNTPLRAGDYPTRPITLVAVFGAGSASDAICRIIATQLGPAPGKPVVVEDRPGADGALAALYVHHQPADGYTLLMGTNSPLSADPYLHKDVNYDPVKDFVPITRVGSFTLM